MEKRNRFRVHGEISAGDSALKNKLIPQEKTVAELRSAG
jgi:hypothetical protein